MMTFSYIKVIENDFTMRVDLSDKENSDMQLTKIINIWSSNKVVKYLNNFFVYGVKKGSHDK